jgi:hypothetical protein
MSDELSSPAIDRSVRHVRALDTVERVMKLVLSVATFAIVVVLLVGSALFVVPRLNDTKKTLRTVEMSQSQSACFAQLNAQMLATAFAALAAPPAPNPARDQQVALGLALAKKLEHPATACRGRP